MIKRPLLPRQRRADTASERYLTPERLQPAWSIPMRPPHQTNCVALAADLPFVLDHGLKQTAGGSIVGLNRL
jgi:hypothetical protein